MTASPTTADTVPPEGAGPAGEIDEEEPEGRRRRILLLLFLLAALLILIGLAIWYLLFRQPIPVPTIPGETVMPGYITTIYGPSRPMGVGVTADGGRIYVGQTGGDLTAQMYGAQGDLEATLLPPLSTGEDHVPVYVAVNPVTGDVYVSDRPTGSIYVYDADGAYLRSVAPPAGLAGWQPLGLGFDAAGNLYVTDVGASPALVRELDASGQQVRVFGQSEDMSFPNGVAVDGAGYAYVTDSNNGRLLVFDQAGAMVASIGRGAGEGNLGLPRGVAVDGSRVYVVDTSGQMVFVYAQYQPGTSQIDYLGSFGTQGVANGQFAYPNGIALDGRGRLYIADSTNDRVQLWSY
jgi:DNA-binding beta-propeller fold protein YncE